MSVPETQQTNESMSNNNPVLKELLLGILERGENLGIMIGTTIAATGFLGLPPQMRASIARFNYNPFILHNSINESELFLHQDMMPVGVGMVLIGMILKLMKEPAPK